MYPIGKLSQYNVYKPSLQVNKLIVRSLYSASGLLGMFFQLSGLLGKYRLFLVLSVYWDSCVE